MLYYQHLISRVCTLPNTPAVSLEISPPATIVLQKSADDSALKQNQMLLVIIGLLPNAGFRSTYWNKLAFYFNLHTYTTSVKFWGLDLSFEHLHYFWG